MRRAVIVGIVLSGLALMATHSAWACKFLDNGCGRSYVPCGRVAYCVPSYYCAPVRCVPVVCEPVCCQPAAGSARSVPSQPAPANGVPTLAPPKPVAQPAVPKAVTETKPAASKPVEQPAASTPGKISLPAELPAAPETPATSAPAKQLQLPTGRPTAPREPDATPVERPLLAPPEKPLIADLGNPFILETDELQIWTDVTGNYRLEARFVGFDETMVRLQRPDGEYVRVAYDRLSSADRERVRDLSEVLAMKMSMK